MARQLLELPPELLVHILALLPLRALLSFSETSHYARSLANSNLYTLSLGIRPVQTSCHSSRLSTSRHRQLQYWASALVDSTSDVPPIRGDEYYRSSLDKKTHKTSDEDLDPHMIWVRIPQAHIYDYSTLLYFHNALFRSILLRHGSMLQNLDLCLWTLSTKIAKAIAQLSALRTLSIRIEDNQYARAVPRTCMARERLEQDRAWSVLAGSAVWTHHLHALRIEKADLNHEQLATLLRGGRSCRELALSRCNFIGKELWEFLGGAWKGRTALQRLSVAECGSVLDDAALNAIGRLEGLQVR